MQEVLVWASTGGHLERLPESWVQEALRAQNQPHTGAQALRTHCACLQSCQVYKFVPRCEQAQTPAALYPGADAEL